MDSTCPYRVSLDAEGLTPMPAMSGLASPTSAHSILTKIESSKALLQENESKSAFISTRQISHSSSTQLQCWEPPVGCGFLRAMIYCRANANNQSLILRRLAGIARDQGVFILNL